MSETHCLICNKTFKSMKNSDIFPSHQNFDSNECHILYKKFMSIYGKSFVEFLR